MADAIRPAHRMSAPRLNEFVTLCTLSCRTLHAHEHNYSGGVQGCSSAFWLFVADGADHQHHNHDQHDDE